jgi:hypothetical protein
MEIKHSKYKNTGILFELLVHQITHDTLNGQDSPAISLIKKYFTKSELGREYKLYESILKSKILNENHANSFVGTILENSKRLNRTSIKHLKYNLIKELKEYYDLDSFFSFKINNYKTLASIYTLIEGYNSSLSIDATQILNNKITLLEYLTKQEVNAELLEEDVLKEFETYDKDLKILTYRVLLNKFNDKYKDLGSEQKSILREFINSVDSTPSLRNFYNTKIIDIKETLTKEIPKVKDKIIKIKIEEILNFLTVLDKNAKVDSEHLVDLLQYYELIKEIQHSNISTSNGKVQI